MASDAFQSNSPDSVILAIADYIVYVIIINSACGNARVSNASLQARAENLEDMIQLAYPTNPPARANLQVIGGLRRVPKAIIQT